MKVLGIVVLLVLGGVLAQGLVTVAQSEALEIERFEVSGNHRITRQELVAASGVSPGDRLLTTSTSKVVARLEEIPWIREARVERILPSTLRIAVVERSAAAVVRTRSGSFLVDSGGLVLEQGEEQLVEITDLPSDDIRVGEVIEEPAFRHAWRAYGSLPEVAGSHVVSISASTMDQVKFNLKGGPTIFFGAAEALEEKALAVRRMLVRLSGRDLSSLVLDVRVPARPTVRSE